jgi:dipeptidyl aminopeptidase/acylaminoacyl peptidase
MKGCSNGSRRTQSHITRLAIALLALAVTYVAPLAQAPVKKPLTIEDYTKWRTITDQAISGDGKWITYVLQLANTIQAESKPVLHLKNLESNEEITVEHATGGIFSADSKWIAYQVDPGAAQRARAGRNSAQGSGPGGSPSTPGEAPAPPTDAPAPPPGAPPTNPATPPATPPTVPPAPPAPPVVPPVTPPTTTPPAAPPVSTMPGATPPPSTQPGTPPPSTGQGAGSGQGARGAGSTIPPRRVELRNLTTGAVQSWQDIQTFAFSGTSGYLFLKRRPAEAEGGAGGRGRGGAPGGQAPAGAGAGGSSEGAATAPRGTDVILLDLRTGRHQLLGSVGDIEFNRRGDLLAYTVDAAVKDANGIFVLETRSGRSIPLDNGAKRYNRLAWNDVGTSLAVLKGTDVEKMRERDNVLMAFPDIPGTLGDEDIPVAPVTLDPSKADGFPKGWLVSDRAPLSWSEDNKRVFFGTKEQVPAPDTTRKSTDESPDVDVWNTADERIQSVQMIRADQDRNFTFRQAFDIAAKRFVKLADETMRELDVAPDGQWAVGRDVRGYVHDFRRPAADFYRVNTATGERTLMLKGQLTGAHVFGIPPHGKHFLYWKDNRFQAYDLDAGATKPLANGATVSFIDTEYDHPGPKPSYGVAKPVTLSAYGEWTKKAGFYTLANGELKELLYEDASFGVPAKAMKADKYLFNRQTFVEFPDLRISGPGFKESTKITDANPQQKEYMWGRRLLFDFKNKEGVRLQGILALPDDYKPSEKRPMIVTFYEKNSQGLHRYNPPTYLTGMGGSPMEAVSRGYITMLPDVHFRTGSSHSDMLECVEAATRKVIEMGYADPKRIGVTGHSYGGEGAAFIGVMSRMFAAVGVGAGVTDLYSDFSQNWGWAYQYSGGSGANGSDYYLYGQGRWGFSPWDQPERYLFESALTHAPKATAPFLIMHGTPDPTVDFNNGLGFYNALRYNGKKAVLLAYPNEGHGLRGMANRRDLTIRFFEFFDHYLRDKPAPKWLTDGVPFLKKDQKPETGK